MKIWPFDRFALAGDGRSITMTDLKTGLEPFRRIRDAVGDRIEIMLEGHGYWDVTTAKKIAGAVEDYRPAWLEDMILAHDVDAIAELKASTSTPIIASEMLITRFQYRHLLERRAADIVMVDPTWAGGIAEIAQDRDPRRNRRAAGRDARLHRAIHVPGGDPSVALGAERDLPGARPGLRPWLVQRARGRTGRDRRRRHSCPRPDPVSERSSSRPSSSGRTRPSRSPGSLGG